MTSNDTSAGYDLVVATAWLPVSVDPLRWRERAGSVAPVLRKVVAGQAGAWVGGAPACFSEAALLDDVWLHPVSLSATETDDFLYGHCDSTLAPLYFDNGVQPEFQPEWRTGYAEANRAIAATIARIAALSARVWIHDYHLQLVPGFLRELRPDVSIGFFLHSPFPPIERFAIQPLRDEIVASLTQADLIGFQNRRSARNFDFAVQVARASEVMPRPSGNPRIAILPTSVDFAAIEALAKQDDIAERAAAVRASLGDPRTVLLSIGAPEHTEASHRLMDAYAQMLADKRIDPADVVLIHVAVCADDRTHQRCDRERLDRKIAQINGVHARLGHPVVHYLHRDQSLRDIVALYRAADVMLALPLRDGMTLAAKEFAAARVDHTGHLVLSEFTGAAGDLPGADIVNPYDINAVADAVTRAANGRRDQRAVGRMRARLRRHDAGEWVRRFLSSLSESSYGGRSDLGAFIGLWR